jgi:hypothetical protein
VQQAPVQQAPVHQAPARQATRCQAIRRPRLRNLDEISSRLERLSIKLNRKPL